MSRFGIDARVKAGEVGGDGDESDNEDGNFESLLLDSL